MKTLEEDAAVATHKSVIVHHQTMTNKPHRPFQLGLVGEEAHQTEFLTTLVNHRAARGGSASLFIFYLLPAPATMTRHNLKTKGKRLAHRHTASLRAGETKPRVRSAEPL